MWYNGLLDLSVWQLVLVTLILTHVTIVSVTVYLHRYSAHNALELHPALAHFFRLWLWLTTGMVTKQWTAIHRKHHAKCETEEDPHSPVVLGLRKVMWQGAELYRDAVQPETIERYGQRTPEDWVERKLYSRFPVLGIALMLVINLALFGALGLTVWAVQMIWIPFFAAGVINGVGHYVGYRNYECTDNARNLVPWGILIGGEELHNNHHTFPNSAKLSRKAWEFDIGWMWIRLFSLLGLAQVKSSGPIGHREPGKTGIDMDTVMAVVNNRFHIMASYRKRVLAPVLKQQTAAMPADERGLYRRAKRLLSREVSLVRPEDKQRIDTMLRHNQTLQRIYHMRLDLQRIWQRSSGLSGQDKVNALMEWCKQAEASGIRYLEEFAASLKTYSLKPA